MDGGQHGPPRREVWSWYHPSSKTILPFKAQETVRFFQPASANPQPNSSTILKLRLLTRSSRFFHRRHYWDDARRMAQLNASVSIRRAVVSGRVCPHGMSGESRTPRALATSLEA